MFFFSKSNFKVADGAKTESKTTLQCFIAKQSNLLSLPFLQGSLDGQNLSPDHEIVFGNQNFGWSIKCPCECCLQKRLQKGEMSDKLKTNPPLVPPTGKNKMEYLFFFWNTS